MERKSLWPKNQRLAALFFRRSLPRGPMAFPQGRATWLPWDHGYSCGTAPDFHRLPPFSLRHPGLKAPLLRLWRCESKTTTAPCTCQNSASAFSTLRRWHPPGWHGGL